MYGFVSLEFSTVLSRFECGHRGEKIHALFMHLFMHLGEKNHTPIHAPFHARGKMSKFENSCTFSSANPTSKSENHNPEFIQDSLRAIARAIERGSVAGTGVWWRRACHAGSVLGS